MEIGFNKLEGLILEKIEGCVKGSEEIILYTSDGQKFGMSHSQDCCESVRVEDVVGDINDLLNSPILLANEESSSNDETNKPSECCESFTWTFYNLSTVKGSVSIRWLGESNGYYSVSVDFFKY